MTDVRIRHEYDTEAQRLADVPFDQLDTIIPTLAAWGIANEEDAELAGQFVYSDLGAYFEVIICVPEAAAP